MAKKSLTSSSTSPGYVQMINPQTTISGTNVTVQTLTSQNVCSKPLGQVTITPLTRLQGTMISKVLLKCSSKGNKKDYKTFSLRNINPSTVTSCSALKTLIRAQLKSEVEEGFDVGYLQNNVIVTIRSSADLCELWSNIVRGASTVLWCDGLKKQSKRPSIAEYSDDEPEEDVSSKKKSKKKKTTDDRNEAVDSNIAKLKELHCNSGYTPMQYQIWAEMYIGGVHSSLEEPPTSTMFVRAGSGTTKKKTSPNRDDSFTQAITQIASALSPTAGAPTSSGHTLRTSPAKLIDNRSKCYKQLADLNNLKQSGLLDDEEYTAERQAIMEVLKQLKQK